MSLNTALLNAVSGLTLNARRTEVIGANVANATTEGYGRREVERSALSLAGRGGGVRIDGVSRNVDAGLIGARRLAEASEAAASRAVDFQRAIETAIGAPGEAGSLGARIAAFESALVAAGSAPGDQARLAGVLDAAKGLARGLSAISTTIQDRRMQAESDIAAAVGRLNDGLARIADLNAGIREARALGRDGAALMDQRQQLIDGISGLVPVRAVPREQGQIALYTPTGAALVDITPARVAFTSAGTIVPAMTPAGGALSGLSINGGAVSTAGRFSPVAGGELAAMFAERDELAVSAQTRLDAVARDLIERFAPPGPDPTLAAGAAGLFTDAGAAFDPADETGLAARIALNPAADPAAGGALWRLRDGLGASAPGAAGDGTLLLAMRDALAAPRLPASGGFTTRALSAPDLAGAFGAGVAGARHAAETSASTETARADALRGAEFDTGVDTDREMRKLLEVESAYAANARVIETVRQMFDRLERL